MTKCIDPRFFDLEIYSIYYAVYEYLKEDTWKVVWRSGEVLYNILKDLLNLKEVSDVFTAIEKVVEWLREVGYVDEAGVERIGEDEIKYIMSKPVILEGAEKLIKEGRVPPHISTALLFAVLRDYGYEAEMIGEPIFEGDKAIERWRLRKV